MLLLDQIVDGVAEVVSCQLLAESTRGVLLLLGCKFQIVKCHGGCEAFQRCDGFVLGGTISFCLCGGTIFVVGMFFA